LDYVEGEFGGEERQPAVVPGSSGLPSFDEDTFNHHFGGFFNGFGLNPFASNNGFGGIPGFGFNTNFRPWYKQ